MSQTVDHELGDHPEIYPCVKEDWPTKKVPLPLGFKYAAGDFDTGFRIPLIGDWFLNRSGDAEYCEHGNITSERHILLQCCFICKATSGAITYQMELRYVEEETGSAKNRLLKLCKICFGAFTDMDYTTLSHLQGSGDDVD